MYNRIKELRVDKDLTQKEVAKYLQIDQSNYSKLELDKQYLKDENLVKLAIYYNTSIDYLLRVNKSEITLSSCEIRHKKMRVSYPLITKSFFCAILFYSQICIYKQFYKF